MENKKLGHEGNLYDTLLHVPFIIKMPDNNRGDAKRIAAFAESVDIMPTILDFLKIDSKSGSQMQGKSLLGLIKNRTSTHKNMIFASVSSRGNQSNPKTMVRNDKFKCMLPSINHFKRFRFYVIGNHKSKEQLLRHISHQERTRLVNLLKKHTAQCSMLYRSTYCKRRKEVGNKKKEIPKEVKKNLKSLGYIN
jgi:arylsulfatase A-like enzyme